MNARASLNQRQLDTLRKFRTETPNKRRNMSTPRYYHRPPMWGIGALIAVIVVAFFALCAWGFYTTQLKQSDVMITVQSKERIAENNGGKYLVFTADDEAFQVTDNILFGKTNASNRYAALDEGKTYDCTAVGVRFSLLSLYKNLIDCKEVGE